VTINDKKVMLTGDELKNLLENTQGDEIRSVEVITNPPAKYEASGSAVLNIVMKKNKIEGYREFSLQNMFRLNMRKVSLAFLNIIKKISFPLWQAITEA
jgi:hypothetical protein